MLVLNWRLCASLRAGSKRELHICPKNLQILKVFENCRSTKTITLSCFHALHSLTEVYIADCYAVILRHGDLFLEDARLLSYRPLTSLLLSQHSMIAISALLHSLTTKPSSTISPLHCKGSPEPLRYLSHLQKNRSRRQPPDGINYERKLHLSQAGL